MPKVIENLRTDWRTMNSPALKMAQAGGGYAMPLNTPWLMYVTDDNWTIGQADDGTPLEGGPREFMRGWYVCEIAVVDGERVCCVHRIQDETVQRVRLEPNDISVVNESDGKPLAQELKDVVDTLKEAGAYG